MGKKPILNVASNGEGIVTNLSLVGCTSDWLESWEILGTYGVCYSIDDDAIKNIDICRLLRI